MNAFDEETSMFEDLEFEREMMGSWASSGDEINRATTFGSIYLERDTVRMNKDIEQGIIQWRELEYYHSLNRLKTGYINKKSDLLRQEDELEQSLIKANERKAFYSWNCSWDHERVIWIGHFKPSQHYNIYYGTNSFTQMGADVIKMMMTFISPHYIKDPIEVSKFAVNSRFQNDGYLAASINARELLNLLVELKGSMNKEMVNFIKLSLDYLKREHFDELLALQKKLKQKDMELQMERKTFELKIGTLRHQVLRLRGGCNDGCCDSGGRTIGCESGDSVDVVKKFGKRKRKRGGKRRGAGNRVDTNLPIMSPTIKPYINDQQSGTLGGKNNMAGRPTFGTKFDEEQQKGELTDAELVNNLLGDKQGGVVKLDKIVLDDALDLFEQTLVDEGDDGEQDFDVPEGNK